MISLYEGLITPLRVCEKDGLSRLCWTVFTCPLSFVCVSLFKMLFICKGLLKLLKLFARFFQTFQSHIQDSLSVISMCVLTASNDDNSCLHEPLVAFRQLISVFANSQEAVALVYCCCLQAVLCPTSSMLWIWALSVCDYDVITGPFL